MLGPIYMGGNHTWRLPFMYWNRQTADYLVLCTQVYIAHRIQQQIPKLRIRIFTFFLTFQNKTSYNESVVYMFILQCFLWKVIWLFEKNRELAVGYSEQDTTVIVYRYNGKFVWGNWNQRKGLWMQCIKIFKKRNLDFGRKTTINWHKNITQ